MSSVAADMWEMENLIFWRITRIFVLNYLLILVHIVYLVWALLAASEATTAPKTASEVKSNLIFEISDPNYLHVHITYMVWALLAASKATAGSKQPQMSNLTSDLKSVTPITYLSMCILFRWY